MFYFTNKLEQPIKEFDSAEREKNLEKAFVTRDELLKAYEESMYGKAEYFETKYGFDEGDSEVIGSRSYGDNGLRIDERLEGTYWNDNFHIGQRETSRMSEGPTTFVTEIHAGHGRDIISGSHVGVEVKQVIDVYGGDGKDFYICSSAQGTYFKIRDMERGEMLSTTTNYDEASLIHELNDGRKIYAIEANDHGASHTVTVPAGHEITDRGSTASNMIGWVCVPEV